MKDIQFGMSYKQVKNKETKKISFEGSGESGIYYLGYHARKYNIDAQLVYNFNRDKLDMAWYDFNPNEDYFTTDELWSVYYLLQAQAEKEFGSNYYYKEPYYYNYINSSSKWEFDGYSVMLNASNQYRESDITLSYHLPIGSSAAVQENQDNRLKSLMEKLEKRIK